MRTSIVGGRVVDPGNGMDSVQDLHLARGKIVATGAPPDDFRAERTIDARGCVVCPGLVDLRAHLREPGQEYKTTIADESRAAAKGGVTTLCCPPDTDPVVDTRAVVELIHQRAARAGFARVEVLGALTSRLEGQHLAEMGALRKAGCVGVGNATRAVPSTEVMRRAMEYAATFGFTVHLHPQDPWLAEGRHAHEGMVATRLGIPGIPETAETIAVARDLLLVEQTGVRAHFCNLSTARAVDMLAEAQARGLPVTADVNTHHLHLTEMDLGDFNAQCHVCPPLRTGRDRDGLRTGIAKGVISAIASDHQPHEPDAKLDPFTVTDTGISAVETLLPLALRLADEGVTDLTRVIAALTANPARILGIDRGTLNIDAQADVCIFDPQRTWTLTPETMISRGHNSPFIGWELKGKVVCTVMGGRVVYEGEG